MTAADVTAAAPLGLGSYPNLANGSFTSDGNATSVNLGYNPRYVMVWDGTTKWEKLLGMPVTDAIKNGAEDATSAILIGLDAGLQEPGSSILLSAALCGTGKNIVWMALG